MSRVITDPVIELRTQAHALAGEWRQLAVDRAGVSQRMRTLLLEVEETPGLSLTETARILGISRPTMYRILEGNGRRAGQ